MATKTLKGFLTDVQKSVDEVKNKLTQVRSGSERKNVLNLKIACIVDVSGSISPKQYNSFMNQLQKIRGMSMVKVVEVDTQVVAMYDYYTSSPSRVVRLGGGGGTDFTAAFEAVTKMNPQAVLILSDGDEAGHVPEPAFPVGWILTHSGCKPPYDWGTIITRVDS